MCVIGYLGLIGGKRWDADETRYFNAKWHHAGTLGVECRGTARGPGKEPREGGGAGGATVAVRGRGRPASRNDEIKQMAVRLAADTASHVDPRCRHVTPLFDCPFS